MLRLQLTKFLLKDNTSDLIKQKLIKLENYNSRLKEITLDLNLNQGFKNGTINLLLDLIKTEQQEISKLVTKNNENKY